jgi:hypothetical protein
LLARAEVGVGEAEGSDGGIGEGVAFGWAATDGVVLHEDDPALGSGVGEPLLVGETLGGVLAVDEAIVWTVSPCSVRALARCLRPRLRSMKNSGGVSAIVGDGRTRSWFG